MSTRTPLQQRYRLGAAAAALLLPLALAGCGSDDEPGSGASGSTSGTASSGALGSIEKGFDGLLDARSASVELSVDGADALAAAATADSPEDRALAELVLGGTIRVTLDPAGDATLRSVGGLDPAKPLGEQLSATNLALDVEADGTDIAGIRLVKGVLYARVDLDKVDELAKQDGGNGILSKVDGFASAAPPAAAAAIADLRAGKWLKLDLVPLADQFGGLLKGLPRASASAAADSAKLVEGFRTAILGATTATGEDGDYQVEIKARQALTSLLGVLKSTGLPGVDMFDSADLAQIGEGTVKGSVKVEGDSLKEITVDLESVNLLLPADERSATPLTGSAVKLAFDDSADEVGVPDDVSDVDLNSLVTQVIGQLAGAFGGLTGATTR